MAIGAVKMRMAGALLLLASLLGAGAASAATVDGKALVRTYCAGCHQEHEGKFDRISAVRKTPEGWSMTLFRMRQVHGLNLPEDIRDSVVRYLADTQGLAPSEAAAGRFALERRPNAQDLDLGAEINVMCGRCHSNARASLQRRDEEEWRKLAHTHVGQWPSLEYSASGRDRPWWQIASGPLPAKLAKLYPYSTDAWRQWQQRPAADLTGKWVVFGRAAGGREFYGTAQIAQSAGSDYRAHYELTDTAGVASAGDSKAIIYTGYEWRGTAEVGGRDLREVYAVSEDGNRIAGRWFDADHAEEGGEWTAVRESAPAQVIAVIPRSIKAGTTATVTLVGVGLGAQAAVPAAGGLTVLRTEQAGNVVHAEVKAAADAVPGECQVTAGATSGRIAVYRQIDQLDVLPAYGIARVGGGRVLPVSAQFEAMASTRLADGKLLELGPVRAQWSSLPYDAEATRTEDDKFAGHFDQRGRFIPAGAGPNPAREYSGDNVGNLKVVAVTQDGDRRVEGNAHLIVTVQRWNTPPIY